MRPGESGCLPVGRGRRVLVAQLCRPAHWKPAALTQPRVHQKSPRTSLVSEMSSRNAYQLCEAAPPERTPGPGDTAVRGPLQRWPSPFPGLLVPPPLSATSLDGSVRLAPATRSGPVLSPRFSPSCSWASCVFTTSPALFLVASTPPWTDLPAAASVPLPCHCQSLCSLTPAPPRPPPMADPRPGHLGTAPVPT